MTALWLLLAFIAGGLCGFVAMALCKMAGDEPRADPTWPRMPPLPDAPLPRPTMATTKLYYYDGAIHGEPPASSGEAGREGG